ncbi:23684_t:CDS:2 [Cetraspora pellucida]|uniref:23684_t:CDS:1 n=1 Tax=Cetraspora pellucida TaxID=1433469 RepID=A0A9N9AVN2_9GLOM|nr:23684_t:CDS:2 [Cetraspora pellucida]
METLKTTLDLDDLVNLETMFVEIGREDGLKNGIKAGALEGRLLGCEKGYEILNEIGFYDGVAEMWLKILEKGLNIHNVKKPTNERLIKQLTSLRELISTFPIENQQNVEFLDLLSKVRSKYKVCTSLLGVTNSQKFKKTTESAPLV